MVYARGIECLVQSRNPNGLSGWLAYAWTRSHYHGFVSGESFDGDYDQRPHAERVREFAPVVAHDRDRQVPGRLESSAQGLLRGHRSVDQEGLPVFVPRPQRNAAHLPQVCAVDFRLNHAFNFSTRRHDAFR